MSDDIVERLRRDANHLHGCDEDGIAERINQAAAEITRLRAQIEAQTLVPLFEVLKIERESRGGGDGGNDTYRLIVPPWATPIVGEPKLAASPSVAPQDERDEILRDFIAAFEAAHGNVSSPWGLIVERARAALSPDSGGK